MADCRAKLKSIIEDIFPLGVANVWSLLTGDDYRHMSTALCLNRDAFDTLMAGAELIDFPILQRASESQETTILSQTCHTS